MIRVNGELVEEELVEETFHRIKTTAEQKLQVSCCERDPEFYAQAEQEVADSILIAQEAERRFPTIPEEEIKPLLKETIDLYREHGASWDMLENQRDYLRHEIAASLRMDKLVRDLLAGDLTVSEAEMEDFFHTHQEEYRSKAEVRSLHLMKPLHENTPAEEVFRNLQKLRLEAIEHGNFEEIAKRETEKSTHEVDLGWITLDRPTNPFEAILFSLQINEISPVIVYEQAMHLAQVIDQKPEDLPSFESLHDELADRTLAHKKRLALQNLALDLRKTAVIEKITPPEEE